MPNHEKTWPMYQLWVVVLCAKCYFAGFCGSGPTSLDDRFLKFLIQLIDMIVKFLKIEFLDLVAYLWPK